MTLWLMLIFSIFFVLGGLALVLFVHDSWLIGLASIVFFGVIAIVAGYMIKVKRIGKKVNNGKIDHSRSQSRSQGSKIFIVHSLALSI